MIRSPRDPRTVERTMMRFRRLKEGEADVEATEGSNMSGLLFEDGEAVEIGAVMYEEILIESVVFVIVPVD